MLTDTSHISITVHDVLLLEIPQDTVVCAAFDFELVANSFGTSNIFLWSSQADFSDTLNNYPSDSSVVVSASETTVYYAKATNEWCERIDSVQVSFILEGLEYTYQDTICYGDSLVITAINVNPDVIFTYQWSPDSIIFSGGNTHEVTVQPTVSQYVYLNAVGNNDCFLIDSFYVTVSTIDPSLVTAFSVPDSIPVGGSAVITGVSPTGFEGYWSSMNVPNPFSAQNTVTLTETTTFMYSVNNGYCSLEVPLVVKVFEFLCEEPYVFVPNAFTPDNSGFNDFLYVRGPYVYEMVFRVFNRWGEKVFETIDQSIGWDGTYNGRPCDPDVYDYYLDIQCIGGMQNIIKGNVTLIR
jgi:gliding motility-associated-like protein